MYHGPSLEENILLLHAGVSRAEKSYQRASWSIRHNPPAREPSYPPTLPSSVHNTSTTAVTVTECDGNLPSGIITYRLSR